MPHTSSSELKSNGLGRFIRARTISDAWHRGLNLIWRQGEEMVDERGVRILELLSLQMVVQDPYQEMIPEEYSWNENGWRSMPSAPVRREPRL